MQLEQRLETYRPLEKSENQERRFYTTRDLESLSSIELYTTPLGGGGGGIFDGGGSIGGGGGFDSLSRDPLGLGKSSFGFGKGLGGSNKGSSPLSIGSKPLTFGYTPPKNSGPIIPELKPYTPALSEEDIENIRKSIRPLFGNSDGGSGSSESSLYLQSKQRGMKIFSEEGGAPLVRLDYNADPDGSKPANHLQYGHNLYTGRHGPEAADILGEILRRNHRIRFSEEESEDTG